MGSKKSKKRRQSAHSDIAISTRNNTTSPICNDKMKLRVLTFSRILNRESNTDEFDWIALGHFDYMRTESINLSNANLFDKIQQKENSLRNEALYTSTYLHSLYLLTTTDDSTKWATDKPFVVVSRIHFKDNVHTSTPRDEFLNSIENNISDKIDWHHYKTSEISDLIVVCWSSNLKLLAEWVMNIRKNKTVGKVYSYFCFQRKYLTNSLPVDEEYTIPVVEIRMSVGANANLTSRIDEIKTCFPNQNLYTLSGYDDLVLFGKDIMVRNLIELYRTWINGDARVNWPFLDVTTSIGANYSGWTSTSSVFPLSSFCKTLVEYNNTIISPRIKAARGREFGSRPIDDLLKAMLSMSQSVTTDELVYLFYPSVKAFIQHLDTYTKEGSIPEKADEPSTLRIFVDKWSEAIELAIRNEGQFSLYPEIHPKLFSFSFFLMEFIMSFLYKCEIILKDHEQDGHEVLLIPVRDEIISTKEIFSQSEYNHGLVIINIPIPKLVDTRKALSILCHEISHFVGEEARCRKERIHKFARSISAEAAFLLFGKCRESLIDVLYFGSKDFIGLHDYLEDYACVSCYDRHHMICIQDMEKKASEWFSSIFTDEKKYYAIWRYAIVQSSDDPNEVIPIKTFEDAKGIENNIYSMIHNQSDLYREIYADICMILLLNLSAKAYINLLEDDPKLCNIEASDSQEKATIIYSALRALLSMKSTGLQLPKLDDKASRLVVLLHKFSKLLTQKDSLYSSSSISEYEKQQNETSIVLYETSKPVLEYTDCCRNKIKSKLTTHILELQALQDAFENVASKNAVDINQAEELIDEFRDSVCNKEFYSPINFSQELRNKKINMESTLIPSP